MQIFILRQEAVYILVYISHIYMYTWICKHKCRILKLIFRQLQSNFVTLLKFYSE